jgi:hypothetical protein
LLLWHDAQLAPVFQTAQKSSTAEVLAILVECFDRCIHEITERLRSTFCLARALALILTPVLAIVSQVRKFAVTHIVVFGALDPILGSVAISHG